jgi:hypothetical protein
MISILNTIIVAVPILQVLATSDECSAATQGGCPPSVSTSSAGAALLQLDSKSAHLVMEDESNPFTKTHHGGCYKLITKCVPNASAHLWFEANWTAWKLGFGLCCNEKYNPDLCDEIDEALFNFTDRSLSGGNLVKNTPDPQLKDFCMEADGLLQTHFSHETFVQDEEGPTTLLQAMTSKASSGVLKKVVSKVGLKTPARLSKLFARASKRSRAQLIQARISHCKENKTCWEEVSVVQPSLLHMAERAAQNNCPTKQQQNQARTVCGSKKSQGACTSTCYAGMCCTWRTLGNGYCKANIPSCESDANLDANSGNSCFPAGARVALTSASGVENIPVEQLLRGAQVLSPEFIEGGTGASTAEYMIDNHAFDKTQKTAIIDFVEISHELMSLGRPLLLTGDHLLFVQGRTGDQNKPSWRLKQADTIREGDVVMSMESSSSKTYPSRVTRVGWVRAQGFFSPLTTSGRLFVEGVAVSSLALSEESWRKAWDSWDSSPDFRTVWAERLLLTILLPSRTFNYFGMNFDWLHQPSSVLTGVAKSASKKFLQTFFI